MTYWDRHAAGTAMVSHLRRYAGRSDVVVLGLVRGGIPVAAAVAEQLGCAMDALVVRKLGVPWAPEVAFGAVGPGGVQVLNNEIAARLDPPAMQTVVRREQAELERRDRRYRLGRPRVDVADRVALIVDDGLATGASAEAAVAVARGLGAREIILAVPVGSREAVARLCDLADDLVCPLVPDRFGAVSRYYEDFGQVSDTEVVRLLNAAREAAAPG